MFWGTIRNFIVMMANKKGSTRKECFLFYLIIYD